MKLWLLGPISEERGSPWFDWCDKSFGLVVRAETEEDARAMATRSGGDEVREFKDAWTSPLLSSCAELTPNGEPGVVLQDFRAA